MEKCMYDLFILEICLTFPLNFLGYWHPWSYWMDDIESGVKWERYSCDLFI